MPDTVLTEEPLQFGEGGRLFGILTLPSAQSDTPALPVFVFLNAGLLHRVGPYRLHVRIARELAQKGFCSLRVDLAGTGDSPMRPGLTNRQSVAEDFAEIRAVLDARLGRLPLVLAGLCAGADNAMRLAIGDPRVIGMVLLDPICFPDRGLTGFRAREVAAKYADPKRYLGWLKRQYTPQPRANDPQDQAPDSVAVLAFRDLPTQEELRAAFASIRARDGRVLSIFTRYASGYYNKRGQLGRLVGATNRQPFCTELFWPQVHHTFTLEVHRRRLIDAVKTWADGYIHATRPRPNVTPSDAARLQTADESSS